MSRECLAPLSTSPLRARCPTQCWTSSGCSGSTTQRYEPSVGMPGSSRTLHNHVVLQSVLFFLFWLQVVIMACREFEMGKVMMFPIIPLAFLYFSPVILQFVWQFSFILVWVFMHISVWVLRFVCKCFFIRGNASVTGHKNRSHRLFVSLLPSTVWVFLSAISWFFFLCLLSVLNRIVFPPTGFWGK